MSNPILFDFLLGIGDDLLILGHRLSEWCGHAPILEEDIALANIALDCIGQANGFLTLAATAEGKGRSADDLAFLRDPSDFKNLQLVEQPNGDFGVTIVRQVLFDAYALPYFEILSRSSDVELAGLAGKAAKETRYHLRHVSDWLFRLGLGTEESKERVQNALIELWEFTHELGEQGEAERELIKKGIIPDTSLLKTAWSKAITQLLKQATLTIPTDGYKAHGSRFGVHTEHLGHLLAEMQILRRSYPGASW